jgi:hypothetical protein
METDGIYISINVEIATEGICRGAETTQNLPVQVNAVWQQMVLLLQSYLVRACVRACLDLLLRPRACYYDSEP